MTSIQHGIDAAQDRKRELETKLAYCTIVSPFDGTVTKRMVDPGHMGTPGKVLFRVEDRSVVRLAFDVPQDDLSQIQPGLRVVFSNNEEQYSLPLSRLYPSLNAVRMTRAEVDMPGEEAQNIITGTYIPLSVELRTHTNATVIPASSLVGSADEDAKVFVVDQGQLVLRPVTVLANQKNELAVSGIQAGEQVVVHTFLGWTRYYPGQKVEVVQ
jgi:RND family efflux transporter MFP subunit